MWKASQARVEERKASPKMLHPALVWKQQSGRPVARSVASSAPQTETSTTVGTIGTVECTAPDLCATTMAQHDVVNPRSIPFHVDNAAGGTVWPMNANNDR